MKRTTAELTVEEREIINTLVSYPHLERAFAEDAGAQQIKRRMRQTVAELERIIRRGAAREAAQAAIILTAYQTTLDFLDELEQSRRRQAK